MSWASVWLHLLEIAKQEFEENHMKKQKKTIHKALRTWQKQGFRRKWRHCHISVTAHSPVFFFFPPAKFSILWTSCRDLHQRHNKFRCWSLWECNGADANVDCISCKGHWSVTSYVWVRHAFAWASSAALLFFIKGHSEDDISHWDHETVLPGVCNFQIEEKTCIQGMGCDWFSCSQLEVLCQTATVSEPSSTNGEGSR